MRSCACTHVQCFHVLYGHVCPCLCGSHQGCAQLCWPVFPAVLAWPTVQENHHCALTFAVLSQRGANLFCRFTREEFFAARKLLIDAILGTDMHHHFALTQELLSHTTVFQAEEDADRTLLVRCQRWYLQLPFQCSSQRRVSMVVRSALC